MNSVLDNPKFWRDLSKKQLIPVPPINPDDPRYYHLIIPNGSDEIVLTITDKQRMSYDAVFKTQARNILYTVFNFGDLFEFHIEYCYLRKFDQKSTPTGIRVSAEEVDFTLIGKMLIMGEPTTQADVDHYLTLLVLMVSK